MERLVAYFVFGSESSEPVRFDTLGAAITEACKRLGSGDGVLRIKGSDGLVMERPDVAIECERRRAESKPQEARRP
jgi:hypothetical protein